MDNLQNKTLNCLVNEPRLKALEEGFDDMRDEMKDIESRNVEHFELLAKLDTLVEITVEDRKDQKERLEEERKAQRNMNENFICTLSKINENITGLNYEIKDVSEDNKQIVSRVERLEGQTKSGHIDLNGILTKAVETLITTGVVGGVIWVIAHAIN